MLKCIIVDDERLARDKLKRLLGEADVDVIGEAADGPSAIEQIEQHQPDLVILDIQMPGMNGFDVLRHLQRVPSVIFSTAFDQYAIRAFDVNAVDYLLKPYDVDRLKRAIDKVRSLQHKPLDRQIRTAIESALKDHAKISILDRLPVRIGARIKLLPIADVAWFDSEHSITFAHVGREKHDVKYTLDELETRLDDRIFFRIHRSSIVNLPMVSEIIPWFNGQLKIKLKGHEAGELIVSRSRAPVLKERLHL